MSQSHDYYHYSSKDSRREIKREERLPSIHHMVGDSFERKASPYDFKDVKRSLPRVSDDAYSHHSSYSSHYYGERGPTLPPIHSEHSETRGAHSSYPSHTLTSRSRHDDTSSPKQSYSSQTHTHHPDSSHGVFRALYPSKSGDLVTVSTSFRPQGVLRSSELPDDEDNDPKKKHQCLDCGKRFDRPSGLEQHRTRHTGERAHPCPVSGCDKIFSVRSNMTRHVRTQHNCEPSDVSRHDGYSHYSAYSTSRDKSSLPASIYSSSRRN